MSPKHRGSGSEFRRTRWPLFAWLGVGTALAWLWMAAWTPGGPVHDLLQGGGDGPAWREPDKWAHAATALVLSLWLTLGWRLAIAGRAVLLPAAAAGLIALSDEWTQLFAPGRNFDWGDLAASLIGVLLSLPLAVLIARPPESGNQIEQPAPHASRRPRRGQVQDQTHRGADST